MKREYWIGGIFFLAFLAFMIGVTVLGGKPAHSPQPEIVLAETPQPETSPTPTAVPLIFEENIEAVTEPVASQSITLSAEPAPEVLSATDGAYWVAGYCKGEDGSVLANVKISVQVFIKHDWDMSILRGDWDQKENLVNTDANGYYTVALPGPNTYQIRAEPPGNYLSLWDEFALTPAQRTLAKHFTHPLAPFQVRGKVIDKETKAPISGASVHLFPRGGDNHSQQRAETALSSSDGSFVISRLAKGTFVFIASAEGYQDYRPFYPESEGDSTLQYIYVNHSTQDKEYTIEMTPGGSAVFRVIDGAGRPVSNALIQILRNSSQAGFVHSETTSVDGEAKTSELPYARLIAQAGHPDYGTAFSAPFQPGSKENPPRIAITLDGSATVSGHVTNAQGAPVPGKEIAACYLSVEEWNQFPELKVHTDPSGYYCFAKLSAGDYRIEFTGHSSRSISYQNRKITLQAGDRKVIDFQMGETRELRGKVVEKSDSKPVEKASVFAVVYIKNNIEGTDGTETDANGEFTIPFAPKGDTIQFQVDKQGYSHTLHDRQMDGSYYTLTLDRAGRVRGVVLSPDNQPLAGAKVWPIRLFSFDQSPTTYQTVLSNNDGSFEFADLYPMDYRFRASYSGYTDTDSAQVSLHQGESLDGVIIQMKEGVPLQGLVLDPQGQPLPGAAVSLFSSISNLHRNSWSSYFSEPEFPVAAVSGSDGTFQIEDFPEEGDVLIARHENFAPSRSSRIVPNPDEPQTYTIAMSVGGRIVGKVLDKQNQPMKAIELHAQNFPENLFRYQQFTNENGEFAFDKLPVIPFQVLKPMHDGEKAGDEYKTVVVIEGQEVRCDFGGGEGALVHGTVFKGKDPYPNVAVSLDGTSSADFDVNGIGNYFMTVTGEAGNYSFQAVPPGTYRLLASTQFIGGLRENTSEFSTSITISEGQTDFFQDIFLGIFTITGTVIDADTRQPLNHVAIRPSSQANFPTNYQLRTVTDENGIFVLRPQDPGTYYLSAIKDGYETEEFAVTIEPDGTSTTYTVAVEMNLIQDDMILIAHLIYDGESASASWVHFHSKPQPFSGSLVANNLPEPGGYRVTGMPEGDIEISVDAWCNGKIRSSFPRRVFMQKDRISEIVMNLFETRQVFVVLQTPENQPINNVPAWLEILGLPGETFQKEIPVQWDGPQGQGHYFYTDLPMRSCRVRISIAGYQPVEFDPAVAVQPDPNKDRLRIDINLVRQ